MCVVHSQRMGFRGHELRETPLVAADGFGDGDRYVIRRTGDDRLDRIFDTNRFTRPETEFGWLLRGGIRGDMNLAVEPQAPFFELFEQKIERHHLGDRGREALVIFVKSVKRPAGITVDDDGSDMRWGATCAGVAVAEGGFMMVPAFVMRLHPSIAVAAPMAGLGRRRQEACHYQNEASPGCGHFTAAKCRAKFQHLQRPRSPAGTRLWLPAE